MKRCSFKCSLSAVAFNLQENSFPELLFSILQRASHSGSIVDCGRGRICPVTIERGDQGTNSIIKISPFIRSFVVALRLTPRNVKRFSNSPTFNRKVQGNNLLKLVVLPLGNVKTYFGDAPNRIPPNNAIAFCVRCAQNIYFRHAKD